MLAKLIVEGKEFDIEILDPKLQELITPKKKTGYERVNDGDYYWIIDPHSELAALTECNDDADRRLYELANYYASEFVAAQNARADKLMRQLRRFAVEHRANRINWDNNAQAKWMIYYGSDGLGVCESDNIPCYGTIYFDRITDADAAIETFRDELIWYFTEYRDSL